VGIWGNWGLRVADVAILPNCQYCHFGDLAIWRFGDFGAAALSFFAGKQVWRLSVSARLSAWGRLLNIV